MKNNRYYSCHFKFIIFYGKHTKRTKNSRFARKIADSPACFQ